MYKKTNKVFDARSDGTLCTEVHGADSARKITRPLYLPHRRKHKGRLINSTLLYCTVTATATEGMPFATTTNELAPVSIVAGTSKFVDTVAVPVATPMVLWSWVLA